jgi:hypothetical protein
VGVHDGCRFQEGGALPVSASAIAIAGETHGPDGSKVPYEVPRALETEEIPGLVASVRPALSFMCTVACEGGLQWVWCGRGQQLG